MTSVEAIKIIKQEKECVLRNIAGCDRNCNNCDLALTENEIIDAYGFAINTIYEMDDERYALLRDFEILSELHRPCELCKKMNYKERNEFTEMHCPLIEWRGVCEENSGGLEHHDE